MKAYRISHSKPFLPPLQEYQNRVAQVWQSGWLTNHGPQVQAFEAAMGNFLGLSFVSYVSSGTMGLQCAMRTLPRGGEVITTPFSYVATAGAAFWEGFRPVFADIETKRLSMDPNQVERLIGPATRAILCTHVYGVPADHAALKELANKHHLALIYDAAHCFGVRYQGQNLLGFGDYAILSLHATKIFHTANGGLVVSRSAKAKEAIDGFRNFGHDGPYHFKSPGINGKNSELHAALGLGMLPYADALLQKRREQWQRYLDLLRPLGSSCFLEIPEACEHNGAYFPLLSLGAKQMQAMLLQAEKAGIEFRRYFYPALNTIEYLRAGRCPVAESTAESVLCLPLYHDLSVAEQQEIAQIVLSQC